jgi:beta-lactamase class A
MGPPPRMRPVPPVRPEHAGGLPLWERLAFAVVLAVMVVFVVVLTISAARAHEGPPAGMPGVSGLPVGAAGTGGQQPAQALQRGRTGRSRPAADGHGLRAQRDRRLAAALAPVRRTQTGNLAVGVTDVSTGVTAVYDGRLSFHTASIVKVDILASLLLAGQRAGTSLGATGAPLNGSDADLAAQMIETSNDDAATDLWAAIGSGGGLAAADAALGLRHTTSGPAEYWGLTTTTAADQLRLLRAVTTAHSPLDARSRDYELDLMRHVIAGQNWGVSAAASPGSVVTIKDGWLPDPALWVVNSIGEVDHDGQRLLMVVLSNDQPTEATGIAQDQAAARAAADWITADGTGRR